MRVETTDGLRDRRAGPGHIGRALAVASVALCVLSGAAPAARAEVERIEPGMVQLSGWAGYQWGGEIDADIGRINIDSAPTYGAQAGLRVQDDGFAFISFTQQSTTARIRFDDGQPSTTFDLDVGYLQIGGELDLHMHRHLVPFIGLSIGATYLKPNEPDASTEWFFSGSVIGGAKIPITKHIGIRTQMRFLGTVISSDTDFYCVSSGGAACAISVDDTTGFIQGDITGGLYVSF